MIPSGLRGSPPQTGFTQQSHIKAPKDAAAMCEDLANDHSNVAKRLHDVIEAAEEARDPVTADLATARAAFHEKAAWMLRALAKAP